ncbi:MAG: hypothetical protein JWN25_274 [Verrucomicrobiales bacterium]|nr:hypothetical protein [Verrucomicrobiales bacterium]
MANIVFDLDGTLVDSLPGIEFSLQLAIEQNFRGRMTGNLRDRIGPPIGKIIKLILPKATEAESTAVEEAFRRIYDERGYRSTNAYPYLLESLSFLKENGFHLYILTNKPAKATNLIVDFLGIAKYFKGIVCLDSNGEKRFENKQAAAVFCATKFSLNADSTWLVGDSLDDAMAAKSCGWRFISACYGYGGVEKEVSVLPDHRIHSLNELEAFFATTEKMV